MAPLSPDNTERFNVYYTAGAHQHSMQIRTDSMSPATLGGYVDTLLTELTSLMSATTIDYVTYAASGSTIANIVTTGIEANTYGSGTPSVLNRPLYINFVGRSTGGRRVRMAVMATTDLAADFRFVAGENAHIDAAIAQLNAVTGAWLAIDGIKAVWKSYANTGMNAYWQRKERP